MKKSSTLVAVLLAGVVGLSACNKSSDTKYTSTQLVDTIVADMNKENPNQPVTPEQRAKIEEALDLIAQAKSPAIIMGGGVILSKAETIA